MNVRADSQATACWRVWRVAGNRQGRWCGTTRRRSRGRPIRPRRSSPACSVRTGRAGGIPLLARGLDHRRQYQPLDVGARRVVGPSLCRSRGSRARSSRVPKIAGSTSDQLLSPASISNWLPGRSNRVCRGRSSRWSPTVQGSSPLNSSSTCRHPRAGLGGLTRSTYVELLGSGMAAERGHNSIARLGSAQLTACRSRASNSCSHGDEPAMHGRPEQFRPPRRSSLMRCRPTCRR